jgi:hypothetical protein
MPDLDTRRFAVHQKPQGAAIDQSHILHFQHDALTTSFQTEKALQLGNVRKLDVTTQRKDYARVGRPLNPQHRFLITP